MMIHILNKPGKLTPEEFEIMQIHTTVGYDMLTSVDAYKNNPLIVMASKVCRWHHERYDGKGYPDHLVGDDIPIAAQLVSIADVYDALTSERCYKSAYTHEKALEMINNGECGVFNPLILQCLNNLKHDIPVMLDNSSSEDMLQKDIIASLRTHCVLQNYNNNPIIRWNIRRKNYDDRRILRCA